MKWAFRPSRILSAAEIVDLEAIAGVKVKRVISVPENAIEIVRDHLSGIGIPYTFETPRDPQRALIQSAKRVKEFMRAEVPGYGKFPDFLMPWQKAGLAASMKWPETSGMLHWSAGAGKTLAAIMWGLCSPARIIVVTKAAVKYQWAGEIKKFTTLTPRVLEGEKPTQIGLDVPIVVINYDILPAWVSLLCEWSQWFQMKPSLILDESQIVQSHKRWDATVETAPVVEGVDPTAPVDPSLFDAEPVPLPEPKVKFALKDNIAVAAMKLASFSSRRCTTTATPAKDRVRNLWAQLDLAHPYEWGGYWQWARRYCNATQGTFGGMNDSGSSNLAELKRRLQVVSHRVKHEEANALLPPKRRIVSYIPIQEQVKAVGVNPEIRAALKAGNPTLVREVLLMEAAGRKRRWLTERAKMVLGDGQKLVIFTGRRRDCDDLLSALATAAPLVVGGHGGHSAKDREAARVAFMAHPGPALLIGTIDAWGECIPAGTMIEGSDKPIEDYASGDAVFGESGLTTCTGKLAHAYEGTVITIKAQGMLPIVGTTGHPMMVMHGGITVGADRHFVFRSEPTWIDIEQIVPWDPSPARPAQARGDFVLIPRVAGKFTDVTFSLRDHVKNKNGANGRITRGCPDTLTLNSAIAWVIGLYVAEGSATNYVDGHTRTTWSLGAHEHEAADRVITTLATIGIHAKKRIQKTWMHVTTGSIPFGRWIRKLCGHGAANKKIPHEVLFNTDLQILRAFLDGYAEGDGSFSDSGRKVQAATVSRTLALNLQLAIARFGRLAGITPWKAKPTKIGDRVINGGPYFIITWRWTSRRHDRFKVLDQYIAVPVKATIRAAFTGHVASLTTADSTFLVANAITHNGLNLQDSDRLIVGMLPYTPGAIVQLEGRVARLGQTRPVIIEYGVCEGTIDERVSEILLAKLPALEKVIDQDEVKSFGRELIGADDPGIMEALAMKILNGSKRNRGDDE